VSGHLATSKESQPKKRLRKKIEIDPALPRVIITHHRQGYSFAGKEEAQWFPEEEWA